MAALASHDFHDDPCTGAVAAFDDSEASCCEEEEFEEFEDLFASSQVYENPLSDSDGLLSSANQVLDEAIDDISDAESAMGTVYVDGVEIMGQGKQDKISAAANSIIEVARYSWLPIYSSATMFCMIASSYI